jgi:hypothetical protein
LHRAVAEAGPAPPPPGPAGRAAPAGGERGCVMEGGREGGRVRPYLMENAESRDVVGGERGRESRGWIWINGISRFEWKGSVMWSP